MALISWLGSYRLVEPEVRQFDFLIFHFLFDIFLLFCNIQSTGILKMSHLTHSLVWSSLVPEDELEHVEFRNGTFKLLIPMLASMPLSLKIYYYLSTNQMPEIWSASANQMSSSNTHSDSKISDCSRLGVRTIFIGATLLLLLLFIAFLQDFLLKILTNESNMLLSDWSKLGNIIFE